MKTHSVSNDNNNINVLTTYFTMVISIVIPITHHCQYTWQYTPCEMYISCLFLTNEDMFTRHDAWYDGVAGFLPFIVFIVIMW